MKKKPNWLLIIGLSVGGLCLLGCIATAALTFFFPSIYHSALENSSLSIGAPAPDFELTSLTGETIRLSQFQGRPVLLSLGASWCPDCRAEAPLLEELHQDHPELVILLVDSKETPEIVQAFVNEFDMTQPVLLYQIVAIPTEVFIDKDGMVRAKLVETVTPELLAEKLRLIGMDP